MERLLTCMASLLFSRFFVVFHSSSLVLCTLNAFCDGLGSFFFAFLDIHYRFHLSSCCTWLWESCINISQCLQQSIWSWWLLKLEHIQKQYIFTHPPPICFWYYILHFLEFVSLNILLYLHRILLLLSFNLHTSFIIVWSIILKKYLPFPVRSFSFIYFLTFSFGIFLFKKSVQHFLQWPFSGDKFL